MSAVGKAVILARTAAMRSTAARQNAALATLRTASSCALSGGCSPPETQLQSPPLVASSRTVSGVRNASASSEAGGPPPSIPGTTTTAQTLERRSYSSTPRRLRRRNYSVAPSLSDAELAGGEDLTSLDGSIGMEELTRLASQKSTPLSLANMYRYASVNNPAQRLRNAQFLHRELPIRIAQRAVDLLTLPHGLNNTRQVRSVANIYLKYLAKLQQSTLPTNDEEEHAFTDILHGLVLDRTSIPAAIARGISTLRDDRREELDVRRLQEMEEALYRFFTARVGLRFLTEHHILSDTRRRAENQNVELRSRQSCLENVPLEHGLDDDFLGCIQKNCDPVKEVRRVADQVAMHCRECYGVAPDIHVVDCTSRRDAGVDFTYVPHHLQYMLCELLKNSCRATVTRYLGEQIAYEGAKGSLSEKPSLTPIRVVVVKGAEDVTIKIADKAGGLPRSDARKVWSFAHTKLSDTLVERESETEFETDEFTGSAIRGFGLPLARIYARYFGGELTLKSMEGYGVDAYLYLPVLGAACENLPQRVTQSPGNLDSNPLLANYGGDRERDEDFWTNELSDSSPKVAMERLSKRAL